MDIAIDYCILPEWSYAMIQNEQLKQNYSLSWTTTDVRRKITK